MSRHYPGRERLDRLGRLARFSNARLSAAASGGIVVGLAIACLIAVVGIAFNLGDGHDADKTLLAQESKAPTRRPTTPGPGTLRPKPTATTPGPSKRPKPRKSASTSASPRPISTPEPTATEKPTSRPEPTRSVKPRPALTPEAGMIKVLNERRRALGLPMVKRSPALEQAARDCAKQNWKRGTFEHCGHEVLYKGGNLSPEKLIEMWFSSPGHHQALTYASSRNAGAAMVPGPDGSFIAALNIDY